MSSKKKTSKKDQAVDEVVDEATDESESVSDDPADDVPPMPTAATDTGGRRGSAMVAWLALLVSGLAITAIAFDFLRDRSAAGTF